MIRLLFAVAYGAGIPLIGLGLMLSGTALVAFGPPVFGGWVGVVLALTLTVAGFIGVAASLLRYKNVLVIVGAFFPLMIGLYLVHTAFENGVLLAHGKQTACTIVDVTRHEGVTDKGTHVWYVYDLACDRPELTAMTLGRLVGQAGDPLTVLFDPNGRLDTRPADSIGNPRNRAILGALALGVGIALRLYGELGDWSGRSLAFERWFKERQRVRRLAQARARGELQARVGWLLPYGHHNPYDAERTYVNAEKVRAGPEWVAKVVVVQRCQASLRAAPPAIEDVIRSLCGLYVIGDRTLHLDNVVAGDRERVAADDADLRRWADATDAYLRELAAVNRDLWQYWIDRGQRLGVSWGRRALLRSWQDHVRSGYARLARAADTYRPVFDEINVAIATTNIAERDLEARRALLQDWKLRPLWYLKPTAEDGLLIVRSDVSGESAPDGITRPLPTVYHAARVEQVKRLVPVDWDEASLQVCDAELAELSAAHPPFGTTSTGQSLTMPSPVTFAAWFQQEFQVAHDRISDRDDLARRRRDRDPAKVSKPRRPSRSQSTGGGSWPTDPGSGDYGAGDYGGSSYGGGYDGGGGYSGGYDGGGGYSGGYSGGFSGGGSY